MPLWIKFASVFASLSLIQTSIYVASVFVVSPSADYKIEFTFFGIFCMLVALVTQVPVSMGWNWIGGATTKTFHRQQLCYLPFILIKGTGLIVLLCWLTLSFNYADDEPVPGGEYMLMTAVITWPDQCMAVVWLTNIFDDRPSPIDLKWVYLSVLVAYPAFCIWVNFMALKEASVLAENLETNKKK